MAARLRHPNLVQFIGASIEGELILVTELMTTSLGALMHRGPLSEANITSISLDVARALNYLHLMQPHPIIHRDISSGNVLLDPLPEDCWKAKVSDYGSVNLLQHLTTAHPGNPFYAAPESKDPDLQTAKMDIYSFGVLLAEMLTNELPEKKDRHEQILKISVERPTYIKLVRQCLNEESVHRPSAQEIITTFCNCD
jgi:serine/threonine protein kinase